MAAFISQRRMPAADERKEDESYRDRLEGMTVAEAGEDDSCRVGRG